MKKLTNILSVSFILFCIKTLIDSSATCSKQTSNRIAKILTLSFFILLLSCSSAFNMYGQTGESFVKKTYLQMGGGGCSFNGVNSEVGIQAILKNNWSATFSYHQLNDMTPKNQPSDYMPETGTGFFLFIPIPYTNQVTSKMNFYSLTAGKIFSVGRKTWFTTEAGISIVNGEKVTYKSINNANRNSNNYSFFFLFGNQVDSYSNYTTNIESKTAIGGILRADINWAFSSIMGLGAGVFANFNSIQSPVGYNIKLTLGWMHLGKKEKKPKLL